MAQWLTVWRAAQLLGVPRVRAWRLDSTAMSVAELPIPSTTTRRFSSTSGVR